MESAARDAFIPSRFWNAEKNQIVSPSEQRVLRRVFRAGEGTQAQLTGTLPLSQQSISRMVSALEARGMVKRGARKSEGRRGQPSSEIAIDSSFAVSFGISLRADSASCSLVDFSGRMLAEVELELIAVCRESVLEAANEAICELMAGANLPRDRLFGVGLATSGFRVGPGAIFNTPPSLEDFALIDLEALFSDALGLPVWAENDGKAATLAELLKGAGRRCSNFAYIYFATGVGGGIVMDGKPVHGARGNAGEFIGALPIPGYAFPNLAILKTLLEEDGISFKSVAAMAEAYDDRWPAIDRWIKYVQPSMSLIASAASAILDTEEIVLGGLMPHALAERLIPHLSFFDVNRRTVPRVHARVVKAECDGDATAIGAALLPLANQFFGLKLGV